MPPCGVPLSGVQPLLYQPQKRFIIIYGFERDGKMTSRAISGHVSEIQAIGEFQDPMFNPFGDKNPYSIKLYTPPVGTTVVEVPGTYKVNGNKLHIDFPKSFVD